MERNKLPNHLIEIRKYLVYRTWNEVRGTITMEDLAKVFGLKLATAYKYIKEEHDKETNKVNL